MLRSTRRVKRVVESDEDEGGFQSEEQGSMPSNPREPSSLTSDLDPTASSSGLKLKLRFNPASSPIPDPARPSPQARNGKKRKAGVEFELDASDPQDDSESSGDNSESEYFGGGTTATIATTSRQKAKLGRGIPEDMVELPAEGSSKRQAVMTDQEKANKRDENARRRKLQADQKQENEKTDAINRLLKAHSGRARTKLNNALGGTASREGSAPLEGNTGTNSPSESASTTAPTRLRITSSIRGGEFEARLSLPHQYLTQTKQSNHTQLRTPPKQAATCDVRGCSDLRKYRSVHVFDKGACSMDHLRQFNEAML